MKHYESGPGAHEMAEKNEIDAFMETRFSVHDEGVPEWARDTILTLGDERSMAAHGEERDDQAYRSFKAGGEVEVNNVGILLRPETRDQLQDMLDSFAKLSAEPTEDEREDAEMDAGMLAYSSTLYYLMKHGYMRSVVERVGRERIEKYVPGTDEGKKLEQDVFIALYDLGLDAERIDT